MSSPTFDLYKARNYMNYICFGKVYVFVSVALTLGSLLLWMLAAVNWSFLQGMGRSLGCGSLGERIGGYLTPCWPCVFQFDCYFEVDFVFRIKFVCLFVWFCLRVCLCTTCVQCPQRPASQRVSNSLGLACGSGEPRSSAVHLRELPLNVAIRGLEKAVKSQVASCQQV